MMSEQQLLLLALNGRKDMSKHTRGPWHRDENCFYTADGQELGLVYDLHAAYKIGEKDQCLHDANLIAAAPELLELVQYVLSAKGLPLGKQWRNAARAAIAKAKGDAPWPPP